MAHIVDTLAKHFTGHVGPVRFRNGHADCDEPDLLAYFAGQPDRYVVEDDQPAEPPADTDPDKGPDPEE